MTPIGTQMPAIPAGDLEQVSDAELARYAEMIYQRTWNR